MNYPPQSRSSDFYKVSVDPTVYSPNPKNPNNSDPYFSSTGQAPTLQPFSYTQGIYPGTKTLPQPASLAEVGESYTGQQQPFPYAGSVGLPRLYPHAQSQTQYTGTKRSERRRGSHKPDSQWDLDDDDVDAISETKHNKRKRKLKMLLPWIIIVIILAVIILALVIAVIILALSNKDKSTCPTCEKNEASTEAPETTAISTPKSEDGSKKSTTTTQISTGTPKKSSTSMTKPQTSTGTPEASNTSTTKLQTSTETAKTSSTSTAKSHTSTKTAELQVRLKRFKIKL